jgi:O-antigen/teichoic acid export membrane protein
MKHRKLKERIIKNSFWAFTSSMVGRLGALLFTIILARYLQPEKFGIYSLILSTAMIFYTFADLGINSTLVRYVSHAITKDKLKVHSYYRYLLKLKFLLTTIVSLLLLILSYPLSFYVFKNEALFLPFLVSSAYIFVMSFDSFYTSMFYIVEKVKYIGFRELFSQILRIVFALSIFYTVAASYQVVGIFVSLTLISFLMLLFVLYYVKKLIPEIFKPSLEEGAEINKLKLLKFTSYLTIAGISGTLFAYIDSVLIGYFLSIEYVGYYRAAFALVNGVMAIVLAPTSILLPVFTKLENAKTSYLLERIFKYSAIIAVPAAFGLMLFGKYFIRFFYDYSYLPAALPLYFLSFLIIPAVYTSILFYLFSAKEKPQIYAKIIVITSILNVILNFIFIKLLLPVSAIWATAGASIATLISWTVYFMLTIHSARKDLKLDISLSHIIRPLFASLVMAGILYYLQRGVQDMTFISGALYILLGVLIYFTVLFLVGGIRMSDMKIIKLLKIT